MELAQKKCKKIVQEDCRLFIQTAAEPVIEESFARDWISPGIITLEDQIGFWWIFDIE